MDGPTHESERWRRWYDRKLIIDRAIALLEELGAPRDPDGYDLGNGKWARVPEWTGAIARLVTVINANRPAPARSLPLATLKDMTEGARILATVSHEAEAFEAMVRLGGKPNDLIRHLRGLGNPRFEIEDAARRWKDRQLAAAKRRKAKADNAAAKLAEWETRLQRAQARVAYWKKRVAVHAKAASPKLEKR